METFEKIIKSVSKRVKVRTGRAMSCTSISELSGPNQGRVINDQGGIHASIRANSLHFKVFPHLAYVDTFNFLYTHANETRQNRVGVKSREEKMRVSQSRIYTRKTRVLRS